MDTSRSETDSDFDHDIDRPDLCNDSSSQSDIIGGIVSSDRRRHSRVEASGSQTKGRRRGQVKGRGRGRRQPTGQCGATAIQLSIHDLSEVDSSTPKTLEFSIEYLSTISSRPIPAVF